MKAHGFASRMIAILLCVAIPLGTAPISQEVAPENGPSAFNFRQKIFGPGVVGSATPPDSGTNNQATLSYPSPIAGRVGVPLSAAATTGGLASPVAYAVTGGAPPAGVDVDPATGTISGIPGASGTFGPVTITATSGADSASASVSFQIAQPSITYPALTAVTEGQAVSIAPTQSNISANAFTLIGSAPNGTTFSTATGVLGGNPTEQGSWTFFVQASASDGASALSNGFQLTVGPAAVVPSATMASINGQVGTLASGTPSASGFSATPTWTLSQAAPFGLALNASTGTISGTPTSSGTVSGLVLTATAGAQSAQTAPFSITIAPGAVSSLAVSYAGATVTRNAPNTVTPVTTGAVGGVTYALTGGTLPPGMTLDSSSGAISGTPTNATTYAGIVISATDSQKTVASPAFSINVVAPSATGPGAQTAFGGGSFTSGTPTTNISSPTWSLASGTLPSGLTLNPSTGVISGTVPAGQASFAVSLTASNGGASATTASFTTTVNNVSGPAANTFSQGNSNSYTYTVPGLTGTPTWSVVSGTVPAGLTLSTGGVLSGMPTGTGTQPPFTVGVTTTTGFTATAAPTTLTLAPLLALGPTGTWTVGQFSSAIPIGYSTTAPSPNPWTFTYAGAEMPPGVYHSNTANGSFAGTPWQSGTYPGLKFRATNSTTGAVIESPEFTITVNPAPGAPLNVSQPEDGVLVRARGFETVMTARLNPSDPLAGSINSSRTLYVRPRVTADANGQVNGSLGITRAPWQPAGLNGAYLDGSNNSRYGWIQPSAAQTVAGIYPNLSFIVSDTSGGTIASGRTGRTGTIGPFTLKIFDAVATTATNNTPASISPASGTVLTAGMAGDLNYTFNVYGQRATINCTVGQTASYRVHSLLPDGTWARMVTRVNQVCPVGGYVAIADTDMVGVGQTYRISVDAGQITWSGGKIDSNNAIYTP